MAGAEAWGVVLVPVETKSKGGIEGILEDAVQEENKEEGCKGIALKYTGFYLPCGSYFGDRLRVYFVAVEDCVNHVSGDAKRFKCGANGGKRDGIEGFGDDDDDDDDDGDGLHAS